MLWYVTELTNYEIFFIWLELFCMVCFTCIPKSSWLNFFWQTLNFVYIKEHNRCVSALQQRVKQRKSYRWVAIFSVLLKRAFDGNERSFPVKRVRLLASHRAVADGVKLWRWSRVVPPGGGPMWQERRHRCTAAIGYFARGSCVDVQRYSEVFLILICEQCSVASVPVEPLAWGWTIAVSCLDAAQFW